MEEIKRPISQTIRYADGTETTVHYNELGAVVSEPKAVEATVEVAVEETVETPEVVEETTPEAVEVTEEL